MSIASVTNPTGSVADGQRLRASDYNGSIDTLYTYLNGTVKAAIDSLQASPANPLVHKSGMIGHNGVSSAEYDATSVPDGYVLTRRSSATYGWQFELAGGGGLSTGFVTMWFGTIGNIPAGWALCNGSNGTPNMQGYFPVGAGDGSGSGSGPMGTLASNATGGNKFHAHSVASSGFTGGESGDTVVNNSPGVTFVAASGHVHSYSFSTTSASVDGTPPYRALHFIMKL